MATLPESSSPNALPASPPRYTTYPSVTADRLRQRIRHHVCTYLWPRASPELQLALYLQLPPPLLRPLCSELLATPVLQPSPLNTERLPCMELCRLKHDAINTTVDMFAARIIEGAGARAPSRRRFRAFLSSTQCAWDLRHNLARQARIAAAGHCGHAEFQSPKCYGCFLTEPEAAPLLDRPSDRRSCLPVMARRWGWAA